MIHYAENFKRPGLPKWPELRVVGESVTEEQAAEMIVRLGTSAILSPSTNDRAWEKEILSLTGLSSIYDLAWGESMRDHWKAAHAWREKLRSIELEYLDLNRAIATSYIGGCVTWVAWNGAIGQTGHNIGKWPSVETVAEEWQAIAEAFPFLRLRAQLFSGEWCEEGIEAVVEYSIQNGDVFVGPPTDILPGLSPGAIEAAIVADFHNRSERGCALDRLRNGMNLVLQKFGEEELSCA